MPPRLQDLPPPPTGRHGWPWTEASSPALEAPGPGATWPVISLVTASYNYGRFLEETIRSVLLQGYPALEYFVYDGGSTDESVAIIRNYAPWLTAWVSEPDQGQSDAINKGLARASGAVAGWLNADDLLRPGALQAVGRYWATHPDCRWLTGDGAIVDATAQTVEYAVTAAPYTLPDLLAFHRGRYLPQPSVFFSRQTFLEAGRLDIGLTHTLDLDLWLRLIQRHRLHHLPLCLSWLRHHEAAKTWRDNPGSAREVRLVTSRYLHQVPHWRRLQLSVGLRQFQAAALCRHGLRAHDARRRGEAARAFRDALRLWPIVLGTRPGLALGAKLLRPSPRSS